MPSTISLDSKIHELCEAWPAAIELLASKGLPQLRDPEKRAKQGRYLSLGAAARFVDLEPEALLAEVLALAGEQQLDVTLEESEGLQLLPSGDVRISGLLPCPVRLPLLELVREKVQRFESLRGRTVGWSLAAAAVGADGLNSQIAKVEHEEDLPEVFISAGFESFFDQRNLARFADKDVFVDIAPPGVNAAFDGLDMRDPRGAFTMLGVVPAVFLLNNESLAGDPAPRSWEELLEPRYAGRIALPVGDFDLFNGILLDIDRRFGAEGVKALGHNMQRSLHPSQTVGRFAGRTEMPAVSIIPWFFGRMTMGSSIIRAAFPEDGAIISPIFMLVRRSGLARSRELAELFLSREVGEVFSHKGRFPVLDPAVDNQIPEGGRFSWLGWDHIQRNDLGALIPKLNAVFAEAHGGEL